MADYRGGIGAQPGFEKSWQDPQGALVSQKSTRNQPGRVWSFPREKSPKGHSAGSRGESPACDHRGPAGSGEQGQLRFQLWHQPQALLLPEAQKRPGGSSALRLGRTRAGKDLENLREHGLDADTRRSAAWYPGGCRIRLCFNPIDRYPMLSHDGPPVPPLLLLPSSSFSVSFFLPP